MALNIGGSQGKRLSEHNQDDNEVDRWIATQKILNKMRKWGWLYLWEAKFYQSRSLEDEKMKAWWLLVTEGDEKEHGWRMWEERPWWHVLCMTFMR